MQPRTEQEKRQARVGAGERREAATRYVERHGIPADETFRQRLVAWVDEGGVSPLPETE